MRNKWEDFFGFFSDDEGEVVDEISQMLTVLPGLAAVGDRRANKFVRKNFSAMLYRVGKVVSTSPLIRAGEHVQNIT